MPEGAEALRRTSGDAAALEALCERLRFGPLTRALSPDDKRALFKGFMAKGSDFRGERAAVRGATVVHALTRLIDLVKEAQPPAPPAT